MAPSDLACIRRVLDGDAEAFEGLVAAHARTVYRLAYRIVGEAGAAEDAVQETFLRAYRFLARFDQRSRFETWLHRIAVNAAIDQTRQRRRSRALPWPGPEEDRPEFDPASVEPDPERRALAAELGSRTREALAALTPTERAAFVLRHYEGRSIPEIASALGKKENAAKQSIFRAVQKLRRALTAYLEPLHEETV